MVNADVILSNDYYPFGSLVPNRHGSSSSYRYGFNGKENDNEIMGEGNFEDYGMRMYNPRIGRFFSVDPVTSNFAFLTPYQFASNRPIDGVDIDGKEWGGTTTTVGLNDGTFKVTTNLVLRVKVINQSTTANIKPYADAIKQSIENENTLSISYSDCGDGAVYNEQIKTTVVLDYSAPDSEIDGYIGKIYFTDITSTSVTTILPNGNKQVEKTYEAGVTKMRGEFNVNAFSMFIGITLDAKPILQSEVGETGNHEGSHAAGLNHPWELSEIEKARCPEIDMNSPNSNKPSIIENRMNSGENTNKALFPTSNSTSKILDNQVRTMIDNIINTSTHDYNDLMDPTCTDTNK